MIRAAVLGLALLLGCSAAPREEAAGPPAPAHRFDEWKTAQSADRGYSVTMPAPTQEKRAQEGPMRASILWGIDADRTRYEVACFDMPEPQAEAALDELLGKVERGLSGGPEARASRRAIVVGGVSGLQLDVTLPDGRAGRWWIFVVGGMRMFQVSALGPASDRLSAGMEKFFQSFQLLSSAPSP
jgi:hypothetical protein